MQACSNWTGAHTTGFPTGSREKREKESQHPPAARGGRREREREIKQTKRKRKKRDAKPTIAIAGHSTASTFAPYMPLSLSVYLSTLNKGMGWISDICTERGDNVSC